MSRIKLLLDVIEDIRSLGDSLQVLADAMASDEPKEEPKKKSKAKAEPKSEKTKEETPAPVKEEKKVITLEEVRMVLAEKSRAGFTNEVKAIITKHGAEKLSDIAPTEFESVLAEAEVIGSA